MHQKSGGNRKKGKKSAEIRKREMCPKPDNYIFESRKTWKCQLKTVFEICGNWTAVMKAVKNLNASQRQSKVAETWKTEKTCETRNKKPIKFSTESWKLTAFNPPPSRFRMVDLMIMVSFLQKPSFVFITKALASSNERTPCQRFLQSAGHFWHVRQTAWSPNKYSKFLGPYTTLSSVEYLHTTRQLKIIESNNS